MPWWKIKINKEPFWQDMLKKKTSQDMERKINHLEPDFLCS